jgi:hypothetical protein
VGLSTCPARKRSVPHADIPVSLHFSSIANKLNQISEIAKALGAPLESNVLRPSVIESELVSLLMQTMLKDIRYGIRMLAKNPGFTIVAVLTLALGIGANTALFPVMNGVHLNPLRFPAPSKLVALFEGSVQFQRASISYPHFLDWQRNSTFVSMAAFRRDDFNLTGAGEAEHIRGEMVSADFFCWVGS